LRLTTVHHSQKKQNRTSRKTNRKTTSPPKQLIATQSPNNLTAKTIQRPTSKNRTVKKTHAPEQPRLAWRKPVCAFRACRRAKPSRQNRLVNQIVGPFGNSTAPQTIVFIRKHSFFTNRFINPRPRQPLSATLQSHNRITQPYPRFFRTSATTAYAYCSPPRFLELRSANHSLRYCSSTGTAL
jgi:hypothetical protein